MGCLSETANRWYLRMKVVDVMRMILLTDVFISIKPESDVSSSRDVVHALDVKKSSSSNPEQCIVIGDDSGGVVQKERQTEELDLLEKEKQALSPRVSHRVTTGDASPEWRFTTTCSRLFLLLSVGIGLASLLVAFQDNVLCNAPWSPSVVVYSGPHIEKLIELIFTPLENHPPPV